MTDSTYDYTFTSKALQDLLPGQDILVTQWRGTEAVSRPYRFEITVAVRSDDLALEKLLDQPATLGLRKPDGSVARWHGIITQGAQGGHDETYDYYQLVLEPRLARLGLRTWSDIYLGQQLDALIIKLLEQAGLDKPQRNDEDPYDYRIMVPGEDLSNMQREFVCQFEESCLDFLMRKLEFYGVYFWFEQGEECESIVFGNDASQQPANVDNAIYYPKGALDPDVRQIVLTRMDRHVTMRPAKVTLRTLHEPGNVRLDMKSDAEVSLPFAGQGELQSVADHFSLMDDMSASQDSSSGPSVPGATLAQWRAQEMACRSLGLHGEARTPGIIAGRFVAVSEYQRVSNADQYYILRVEHEGVQTLDSAPVSDEPSYRARFTALPRWQDQAAKTEPIQFRPPRTTPVPHITRLLSGFVDMDQESGPKRFAQPDRDGRYKVCLSFVRERYDGYRNSAWLRMSTPYAGGSSQQGLAEAGMHFPLREGTEVLISFLNGDPDQPVIVGALPNTEAPSVVKQDNARQHVLRTPVGNSLTMQDGDPNTDESDEGESLTDDTYVRLSTPNVNTMLSLGMAPPIGTGGVTEEEAESLEAGFVLRTDNHAQIWGGTSMLIEVPNHYRVCAGSETALDKFLGSERTLAPGVTAAHSAGVVFENFIGAKFELAESIVTNLTVGLKAETFVGGAFESMIGAVASVSLAGKKEYNLTEKKVVVNSADVIGRNKKVKRISSSEDTVKREFKTLTYDGVAYTSYKVKSPAINFTVLGARYGFQATVSDTLIKGFDTSISSDFTTTIGSGQTTTIKAGPSKLTLGTATATLRASASIELASQGQATVNGSVIRVG